MAGSYLGKPISFKRSISLKMLLNLIIAEQNNRQITIVFKRGSGSWIIARENGIQPKEPINVPFLFQRIEEFKRSNRFWVRDLTGESFSLATKRSVYPENGEKFRIQDVARINII